MFPICIYRYVRPVHSHRSDFIFKYTVIIIEATYFLASALFHIPLFTLGFIVMNRQSVEL